MTDTTVEVAVPDAVIGFSNLARLRQVNESSFPTKIYPAAYL